MKRLALTLTGIAIAVTSTLLTASPALADDRVCTGTIGAVSIDGDVVVPDNATCKLEGTKVDGNVKVNNGATLIA
ncbi:MAG: hypothetical protein M3Q84_01115, partial [Actinomycetota bacterium]|nr:hypothetical protein [Actinomycetota bacterium]